MLKSTPIRRISGFTLVEVMMASLILVVGFIGLIEAVTVTSTMMDHARRQTLANQIINHELEKLRFSPWTTIGSVTGISNLTPTTSTVVTIDSQFTAAVAASGAAFTLTRTLADPIANIREVTYTVTWVVTTSRRDTFGNLLTFTYRRSSSAWFGKYGLNLTYQRS